MLSPAEIRKELEAISKRPLSWKETEEMCLALADKIDPVEKEMTVSEALAKLFDFALKFAIPSQKADVNKWHKMVSDAIENCSVRRPMSAERAALNAETCVRDTVESSRAWTAEEALKRIHDWCVLVNEFDPASTLAECFTVLNSALSRPTLTREIFDKALTMNNGHDLWGTLEFRDKLFNALVGSPLPVVEVDERTELEIISTLRATYQGNEYVLVREALRKGLSLAKPVRVTEEQINRIAGRHMLYSQIGVGPESRIEKRCANAIREALSLKGVEVVKPDITFENCKAL